MTEKWRIYSSELKRFYTVDDLTAPIVSRYKVFLYTNVKFSV